MKNVLLESFALVSLIACMLCLSPATAHAAYFYVEDGVVGGAYNHTGRTLLDNRYYHVLRQRYDFSCGSAALATLLTFGYGRHANEKDIIKAMFINGDRQKIRKEGFSLLDMKQYLASIGIRSDGFRESLDKLVKVGIPAIVLINRQGYLHFVVVQGVTQDKVLIGDPALGKKIIGRKAFEAMWKNHILFVIESNIARGRSGFNTNVAWNVKKPEQFVMPMPNTDLASFTLLTSYAPNTFK